MHASKCIAKQTGKVFNWTKMIGWAPTFVTTSPQAATKRGRWVHAGRSSNKRSLLTQIVQKYEVCTSVSVVYESLWKVVVSVWCNLSVHKAENNRNNERNAAAVGKRPERESWHSGRWVQVASSALARCTSPTPIRPATQAHTTSTQSRSTGSKAGSSLVLPWTTFDRLQTGNNPQELQFWGCSDPVVSPLQLVSC